ncbi:hypothetical protein JA33_250 [Dickeya phage vB_DsoM_JA33]|uniref:Uncharacterized protein n=3 Tax=Salmondvirus JA11 TaxID=2734141 RepID=A0A384ZWL8_9CAUD|nr:hypothetical protein HOU32_gp249 [Dickeya phage vB_DsoM_JA11]AXG66653.1 hypothetical protein JA13_250 [Dickeya phage vB_DsoM_JA13]AXG67624.1 hypothetical protein JA33_250 [Dickeya phage vB_DsoM_JA33]AYD80054.1 hypothetical protein JA11_249 [Dickeya phage vB_DsoM_JA11]
MAFQSLKSARVDISKSKEVQKDFASLCYTGALRLAVRKDIRDEIEVDFETLSLRFPVKYYCPGSPKLSLSIGQSVAQQFLKDPRLVSSSNRTLRTTNITRDGAYAILHFLQEEKS